jgi:hypothetical protein
VLILQVFYLERGRNNLSIEQKNDLIAKSTWAEISMSEMKSATVINAGAAVSPLNFRGWLREELKRQCFSGYKDGDVMAFIFATRSFITALGGKQFNKIIAGAVKKHPWICDVQLIMTAEPVSDEDAKAFVEAQGDEWEEEEVDYGSLLMGYKNAHPEAKTLNDISEEPSCLIRLITAGDLERVSGYPYKVGDYAVIGGETEFSYSEPFSNEEAAKAFATETYQAVFFLETRGII